MTILDAEGKPVTGDVVIAPTWREMLPTIVDVATRAPQQAARDLAWTQLYRLADIVDQHIAQLAELRDALPDKDTRCPRCGVMGGGHAYGCGDEVEDFIKRNPDAFDPV